MALALAKHPQGVCLSDSGFVCLYVCVRLALSLFTSQGEGGRVPQESTLLTLAKVPQVPAFLTGHLSVCLAACLSARLSTLLSV